MTVTFPVVAFLVVLVAILVWCGVTTQGEVNKYRNLWLEVREQLSLHIDKLEETRGQLGMSRLRVEELTRLTNHLNNELGGYDVQLVVAKHHKEVVENILAEIAVEIRKTTAWVEATHTQLIRQVLGARITLQRAAKERADLVRLDLKHQGELVAQLEEIKKLWGERQGLQDELHKVRATNAESLIRLDQVHSEARGRVVAEFDKLLGMAESQFADGLKAIRVMADAASRRATEEVNKKINNIPS